MTFTYNPGTPNDITRVRFHTADTDSASAIFSDDEITFMISEEGSWQKAVIACILHIIGKLAMDGDFEADWLKVSGSKAREGYEKLLAQKRRELSVPAVASSAKPVYRSDSLQTEAPDW